MLKKSVRLETFYKKSLIILRLKKLKNSKLKKIIRRVTAIFQHSECFHLCRSSINKINWTNNYRKGLMAKQCNRLINVHLEWGIIKWIKIVLQMKQSSSKINQFNNSEYKNSYVFSIYMYDKYKTIFS